MKQKHFTVVQIQGKTKLTNEQNAFDKIRTGERRWIAGLIFCYLYIGFIPLCSLLCIGYDPTIPIILRQLSGIASVTAIIISWVLCFQGLFELSKKESLFKKSYLWLLASIPMYVISLFLYIMNDHELIFRGILPELFPWERFGAIATFALLLSGLFKFLSTLAFLDGLKLFTVREYFPKNIIRYYFDFLSTKNKIFRESEMQPFDTSY